MPAECSPPRMQFARLGGRAMVVDFGGSVMTSDAGALLLGARDRAIGVKSEQCWIIWFLLIRDTPHVRLYVLNMFRMRGSRLWGSRLHRACAV